ncbi:hypothetical protein FRC00_008750 [Tulasnella sp. 408]|nr:hypothetical protein FRC00_008750 [Tulasnella sp. 408]
MLAQVLHVIFTHPIAFIASSAVLVILGDKVELAWVTTPPAKPVSPPTIASSPSPSSGRPFTERENFWSNAIPQDFDSLEWFDLAAPTPSQCDFDDYQQEQDPSSEVSYSWPEAFPVEDEPSNEDWTALQGQGQSEFSGEFEDSTITLPPIVPPSTTSGVTRAGYFSFISHVGKYFFGDGDLDRPKLESKSGAASSNEDPSQSPVAPVSDDFYYGRTPILNYLLRGVFVYICFLLCLWIISIPIKYGRKPKPCCYISFDQLLAEVKVPLLESRIKTVAEKIEDRDNELHKSTENLAYLECVELGEKVEILERISDGARSTSRQELDEGNEHMEELKDDVASLNARNKSLSTLLGRECQNNTELRRLLDIAKAHAERLKTSLAKDEQVIWEAHEARFQATTEASEARKEAES